MSDPATVEEYRERAMENIRYTGHGPGETMAHTPCPFCSAPDFMVFRVIDADAALEAGGTCKQCGRSARAIIRRADCATSFEVVQTGGADPPAYLPKMRRVQE